MIVAVIGKKGGCGKSTIAVHLAGWRRAAGKDIMLVDADRQATSTMWAETRADKGMETPDTVQQFDNSVGRAVRSLARHYEDIVVDVGGGEEAATASVLRVADIAIVPFQPNELDVWTVGALEDLLRSRESSEHRASRQLRAEPRIHPSSRSRHQPDAGSVGELQRDRGIERGRQRKVCDTALRSGRTAHR